MLLLLAASGCGGGYRWRSDFQKAEEDARTQGKILFIFYKGWLDPASNRMLGNEVLSDPLVAAEFQGTINVLIDREYGPAFTGYVRRFNVSTYPACILVAPDGKYKPLTGFVPREQLIEWVRNFKARTTPSSKAAEKPRGL